MGLVLRGLVAAPLLASITATLYDAYWIGRMSGPLPYGLHVVLLAAQSVTVALLLAVPEQFAFVTAGALYLVLGAGGLVIRVVRGPGIPCGCWGAGRGTIGVKLVLLNTGMSSVALGLSASSFRNPELLLVDSALVAVITVGCTLLFIDGFPTYRSAREATDRMASRYRPFIDIRGRK